jgi:hypothetical protein
MKAEEQYGEGGYRCEYLFLVSFGEGRILLTVFPPGFRCRERDLRAHSRTGSPASCYQLWRHWSLIRWTLKFDGGGVLPVIGWLPHS